MIVVTTPEQDELTRLVRRFLAERAPLAESRRFLDGGGFDAAVWAQMGKELGLQGLGLPEEFGGAGEGAAELALVAEEMGRALYVGPFFSTVCLAASALTASCDTGLLRTLAPGLACGETTASLAFAEPRGPWDGATCSTFWERGAAHSYRLSGAKTRVVDGASADLLIVTAANVKDPSVLSLFLVQGRAAGVSRQRQPAFDQTRDLAAVELQDAPAVLIGELDGATPVLRGTLQRAAILLAAEQLGGAQHCLDLSVEYASLRTQFGRAIGSFQAVKHRCVDMLLDVETARSAVLYAVSVLDEGGDAAEASSLARAHCSEVFSRVASGTVQIHGGTGFTWEHDAHLYLKRAKAAEALLGSPSEHRELLAQAMLL